METPRTSLSALDHNNHLGGDHSTLPPRVEVNSEEEHKFSNEVVDEIHHLCARLPSLYRLDPLFSDKSGYTKFLA
ncbi:hypothetical protein B0H13DRAFT_2337781 [Mycena leptocephala]|nr:hypothetical protein B0H13DRAFT_2337781 [Mycena leptocephala]